MYDEAADAEKPDMERSDEDDVVTMGDMVGKLSDDGDSPVVVVAVTGGVDPACCTLVAKFVVGAVAAAAGVEDGQYWVEEEAKDSAVALVEAVRGGGGRMTLVKWKLGMTLELV